MNLLDDTLNRSRSRESFESHFEESACGENYCVFPCEVCSSGSYCYWDMNWDIWGYIWGYTHTIVVLICTVANGGIWINADFRLDNSEWMCSVGLMSWVSQDLITAKLGLLKQGFGSYCKTDHLEYVVIRSYRSWWLTQLSFWLFTVVTCEIVVMWNSPVLSGCLGKELGESGSDACKNRNSCSIRFITFVSHQF